MKKYVQVGCGFRGIFSFSVPLVQKYSDCGELCGVYDINAKRAELVSKYAEKDIPVYSDFSTMLKEVKPDTVIVTSIDSTHDKYIIEALNFGCDVICEKPLTTTFEKSRNILEAERKSGKKVTVTFNLRFHGLFMELKKQISSGVIGDILSVHYNWMLNEAHGSDYFHRWHCERDKSGSLLIHKSTHHFDLANWILEQDPVSVNAFGTRRVYGDVKKAPAKRCLECKEKCKFYLDVMYKTFKDIYYECESEDGYLRDRCVFSDKVDIEDTVSVNVLYSGGTVMSYTLNAFAPTEFMQMTLMGTKGRMDVTSATNTINITLNSGEKNSIVISQDVGANHTNADNNIRDYLFKGTPTQMQTQAADLRAGIMSMSIGAAANVSMKENRRVNLDEFLKDAKL
ncbi:MAG: Gfo/Idh/MocA family oxidoreductase [Clostridia bacterium]|nr:Gfo/Idh/MocA family oxidoreductase [Clostridia bacterium]